MQKWKAPFNPFKSRTFLIWFMSYIAILIVPLMLFVGVYFQFVRATKEEALAVRQNMLWQFSQLFDQSLRDIEKLPIHMGNDSAMQMIFSNNSPLPRESIVFSRYLLQKKLKEYCLLNSMLEDIFWYDDAAKTILSKDNFSGGLIPFFLVVDGLGLTGSIWALIIPYAVSMYNIIIMRTSFSSIPVSLEESARIDGANDFFILFRIILPLSMPVVAVMILFYGVGHWNSWFAAVIFLRDRKLFPLQLILREILVTNDVSKMMAVRELTAADEQLYRMLIKYSTIVVASLPIVCIYPFLQKHFVKGVMIGSIKE